MEVRTRWKTTRMGWWDVDVAFMRAKEELETGRNDEGKEGGRTDPEIHGQNQDSGVCYFPRDLSRGKHGGDVFCLQKFLKKKGYLAEKPSGYYAMKTEEAVAKWQASQAISPAKGYFGYSSRKNYAKKHGLPSPEKQEELERELDAQGVKKMCLDVCSEFRGVYVCETRCVMSESDKIHACRDACQASFSASCDRAYPTSAPGAAEDYESCMEYMQRTCMDTCKPYT